MEIKRFVFNPFMENTYVLYNEEAAIIVDPGCYEKHENDELTAFIEAEELNPILIINTHCHIDHVLGNNYLKDHYKIPLWVPEGEVEVLEAVKAYSTSWGITGYQPATVDKHISPEDSIQFGHETLSCIFAPGHAPGHLMFYHEQQGVLIAGDVIFQESIGRTDLPGGNAEQLFTSIREQVYTLPQDTVIYPGHGPETTVSHEIQHNPFVRP